MPGFYNAGTYTLVDGSAAFISATGSTDYWSDPKGQYLAAQAAEPVYQWFGKKGVGNGPFPAARDDTKLNTLGYYMHDGAHTVLPEDYDIFIRFMIKHFNLPGNFKNQR